MRIHKDEVVYVKKKKKNPCFTLSLVQDTFSNSWISEEIFSLNHINFRTVSI